MNDTNPYNTPRWLVVFIVAGVALILSAGVFA